MAPYPGPPSAFCPGRSGIRTSPHEVSLRGRTFITVRVHSPQTSLQAFTAGK